MSIIFSSLEQTLLLLPLIFGMYLSYKILKITDLTVDGTYVLGAAVFARMIDHGFIIAITCSILSGAAIGAGVACMQRNNKVSDLIVGIIASFMLYSVNIQIMGRPNISLINKANIIDLSLISLMAISIIIAVAIFILLRTNFGLFLRAFGHNQKLLRILGKPVEMYRICGLMISNALAAVSGVLAAQLNGFADINMGFGVALVGIGGVVIGCHILDKGEFHNARGLLSCIIGAVLYFSCMNILLFVGVNPANLKFILGAILFSALRSSGGKNVT